MAVISINGVKFDPAQDAPAMQTFGMLSQTNIAKSDYVLVQTRAPLTAPEKAELERAGVRLLEYVDDAYVCAYKDRDLDRLRALPFVAGAGDYPE